MAAFKAALIHNRCIREKLHRELFRRAKEKEIVSHNGHTIYEIIRQLEQSWNRGNSQRFASFFAEDADFINIFGMHLNGREVIDAGHREIFDTIYKSSHLQYTIQNVRFIRPDVVITFVRAALELSGGKVIRSCPTMMLTRESGRWEIAAFQNTMLSEGRP